MARKKTGSLSLFGYSIFHPLTIILLTTSLINLGQYIIKSDIKLEILITYLFALTPNFFLDGNYWQIITYGFLHANSGFPLHLIMNLYSLYLLAEFLLPRMQAKNFILCFLFSIITGGIIIVLFGYINFMITGDHTRFSLTPTVGASGGIFGLLAIFGIIYSEVELYLFFVIPVKASYIVIVSLLFGLALSLFPNSIPLSHEGHLGGAIGGYIFYYFFNRGALPTELISKIAQVVPISKSKGKISESLEFQFVKNKKLLSELSHLPTDSEKMDFLVPLQVENANICPPPTYNETDEFCLRCEWFANCALRKVEKK
ncbi:MAG: rhomboid family intramembrane serine protease [Leptospiraceae bacterium]|nr:rhomboid family intramembrane serine protease [Leptospiraceae bacterium]